MESVPRRRQRSVREPCLGAPIPSGLNLDVLDRDSLPRQKRVDELVESRGVVINVAGLDRDDLACYRARQ